MIGRPLVCAVTHLAHSCVCAAALDLFLRMHPRICSVSSHPPCPCCPADLFFMLLIMMGFAVAFHVLFRKDQKHEVGQLAGW